MTSNAVWTFGLLWAVWGLGLLGMLVLERKAVQGSKLRLEGGGTGAVEDGTVSFMVQIGLFTRLVGWGLCASALVMLCGKTAAVALGTAG